MRIKLYKDILIWGSRLKNKIPGVDSNARIRVEMCDLSRYLVLLLRAAGVKVVSDPKATIVALPNRKGDDGTIDHLLTCKLLEVLSEIIVKSGRFCDSYDIWERCNTEITKIKSRMDRELLCVHQLDLMITQKCSLKCKDCLNLMQYYKTPENFTIDEVLRDIGVIDEIFDDIEQLHILGGEPFMNPKVYDILYRASMLKSARWIVVFTNATIMPNDRLKELDRSKIVFYISDYKNSKQRIKDVYSYLRDAGFACFVQEFSSRWTAHSAFDANGADSLEMNRLFATCVGRKCPTICRGKVYHCEYLANACMLHAIPDSKDDYCEIKAEDIQETKKAILKYFGTSQAPRGCYYCKRPFNEEIFVDAGAQLTKPLEYTIKC